MTTIVELERALPGGFHDVWLRRLEVDYLGAAATLCIDLGQGDEENPVLLVLSGVAFVLALTPEYPVDGEPGALAIQGCEGVPAAWRSLVPEPPAGCFVYCFFVESWNSIIALSAADARLETAFVES